MGVTFLRGLEKPSIYAGFKGVTDFRSGVTEGVTDIKNL